jgi:hypothetical protein
MPFKFACPRVALYPDHRAETLRAVARGIMLLLGAVALLGHGVAWSAPPVEGTVRLPGPDQLSAGVAVPAHPLADASARHALARELEGWALTWNPANGGAISGLGRLAAREAPAAFAPRFVRGHAALLGMGAADLRAVDVRTVGRIEHRYYRQTYRGLPVEGSRLGFAFGRDGSPLHFTARTAPDIALRDIRPSVILERAQLSGLGGLTTPQSVVWDEGELVVVARRFSGLDRDRLAWRLRCHTEGPSGVWRILVDAHTGELLERESLIVSAGGDPAAANAQLVSGHIDGWVHDLTPFREELPVGFPHQMVRAAEGMTVLGQTFTDLEGDFSFGELELSDPQALVLQTMLAGPFAVILQGAHVSVPMVILPNPTLPAVITWDDSTALGASRAAYVHANTAHDELKRIDPGFMLLDRPVTIFASDSSGACNGYASLNPDAPQINLYAAGSSGGGDCPDIAEIADVVYHEYGHLATMYVYLPEWAPSDLHEAFSDYFATTIVDTNLVGLDFYGEGTYLRNMDNDYVWPREECNGEEHCLGEVLDGALWDMRENLIASISDRDEAVALSDSLFHYMRYGRPMDVHECLPQALLVDDDDDDLSNGTPHLEAIATAFERHQIGDFEVHIAHTPLYDTEDPTTARVIDATLGAIYPVERDSVLLHYSVDGETYTSVTMAGTGYHFSAEIPEQPMGTTVRYYLTAADEGGHRAALPAGAPTQVLDYVVGTDVTPPEVVHTVPGDPVVEQERLWFYATVTDNIGVIDSVLALVSVAEPDSSYTVWVDLLAKDEDRLPNVYEGYLERGPWEDGTDVAYHFEARDGSSQQNLARYPAEGELALETHRGRGWDFESGAADFTLAGDWECGVTHVEPAPAPSGTQLVATVLDGTYNSGIASELTTIELDLTQWQRAMLEFRSWYWTEEEWDGGRVLGSRDHGATWELLIPSGGYPSFIYDTETSPPPYPRLPAFSGEGREWRTHQVPLDAFVGDTLMIRFRHWSDTSVVRLGWYLDDIKIIEAQALVVPEALAATVGEDGRVALTWGAPVGVNTESDNFVGYHIYRTDDLESEPEDLLTTEPVEETEYVDTDVTNGVQYRYGVTAVYATGESPLGAPAVGYPYRAALDTADEIAFDVEGVSTRADTLVIANNGTGELRVSLCLGDATDTYDDLVPHHTFDNVDDEDFTLLAEDGAGALAPDLASLACIEQQGFLAIKIALHDSLPDPLTQFTLLAFLDTDLSRATGMPAGNLGADYFIAIGAMVADPDWGFAWLLRATDEGVDLVAPVPLIDCQTGSDSLVVGVPLLWLGFPQEIGFGVQVILSSGPGPGASSAEGGPAGFTKESPLRLPDELVRALAQTLAQARADDPSSGDQLPDARQFDWLTTGPLSGMATPEEAFKLPLDFDFTGRQPGELAAKLYATSNDPDQPLTEIPVTANIFYLPPEGLACWETDSRTEGLMLAWSPADPDSFDAFQLHRWSDEETEAMAVVVGGGPVTAPDDSLYQVLDRGVESGQRYYYRLAGIKPGGETVNLSPTVHPLYEPSAAAHLTMEAPRPNPFSASTTFRMHAPEGTQWELFIVDVSGRLVRQLVRKGDSEPGVHMIQWDCRSEEDQPVSQGVYYAVARAGSRLVTRSMVLVR